MTAFTVDPSNIFVDETTTVTELQFLPALPDELDKSNRSDWHCPIEVGDDTTTTGLMGNIGGEITMKLDGSIANAGPHTMLDGHPTLRLLTKREFEDRVMVLPIVALGNPYKVI